ncbi:MAG: STAS domain-containing protein [Acidimicrobiales bacterium]
MAEVHEDATSARFAPFRDDAGVCVLRVAGEVDMSNAAQLRSAVDAMLAENPQRLVLDVRELTFMDSSGLAVLLQAAVKIEALILRHAQRSIVRLIETTGVTSVLQVEP